MSPSQRRSKILVDKQVQGTIVRQLILHWIIACLVTVFYLLVLQVFMNGLQKPLSEHLSSMWTQYGSLVVVLVTLFPVFIYDSIRVSHRFAGPMVTFRRKLKSLAEGESIDATQFRGNDFWSDMANQLNLVAERLNQTVSRSQQPSKSAQN